MSGRQKDPSSASWRRWSADAHSTARRVTHDPSLADDIAQEALVLLVRGYSSVRDLHSWLLVVLRRLAAKSLRKAKTRDLWPDLAEFDKTLRRETPDSLLDLKIALACLPPRQAQLLALSFEGYSHAEIAKEIGCQTHQVGPRLARAYRALGRRLGVSRPEDVAKRVRPRAGV